MFPKFVPVVILAVLVKKATALTDEQKTQLHAKYLKIGANCNYDHPLSEDDVTALKNKEFPVGENASCFAACVLREVDVMDDQGNISKDKALENAKELFDTENVTKIEQILNICEKEVSDGEAGCDRAKLAFNCFVSTAKEVGFEYELKKF